MSKIVLPCSISGENAYESFKKIASEFYRVAKYKFVSLKLNDEPKEDSVSFEAEFWEVKE